jgi:phage terminase large subunit
MDSISPFSVPYSDKEKGFDYIDNKYITKNRFKSQGLHLFLFPDKFYKHLETEKRYSLWVGGNGSAKSTSKARYFIAKCLKDSHFRLLFVRHNHVDIRSSVFLMFKGIIEKEGLGDYFTILESTMIIVCKTTGNMMISTGLDNTGKLSGIDDITDIWFEEPITRSNGKIEMITHEQFEDLDSRLRMPNVKLTMHLTLNPISKDFFIYKNLINPKNEEERKYKLEDWDICNSNYLDNPFLPDDYIKLVEGFKGHRRQYGTIGEWVDEQTGNEWVHSFDADKHVKPVAYITDLPVHKSFDFNMLPYQTCLDLQIYRKKNDVLQIRVFKEYCLKPPLNTPENACNFFIQDYIEPYGYNNILIYGDASGKFGYNNYHNLFTILKPYLPEGYDQVFIANPPLRMARDLINEILDGEHQLEMIIDPCCENLIKDLQTLQTTADGFDNEKKKGIEAKGHCYSALVYVVCKIFEHLMKHKQRDY